jgi:23S rRNA (adenine2503-C2)-methyltransferase
MIRRSILDFTQTSLAQRLEKNGIEAYRAAQILRWIYRRQADSFDDMSNLSKALRHWLHRRFTLQRLPVEAVDVSRDGSRKYLFRLFDGKAVESVLIPERDHYTLCISSQVGCAQGCRFCMTGTLGLQRNLTAGEMLAQVRDIRREIGAEGRLTNVVFMGMGEPLANYRPLVSALGVMTDNDNGLGFSQRKVTVSTVGLVPKILALGRDAPVNLAVSLNAVDNSTRNRLMPINRRYPLEALLEACRRFPLPRSRRITFEYILIKGVNDSRANAVRLAKLLRPLRCKINLIPFNAYPLCEYERPAEDVVRLFQEILLAENYTVIIRHSKGGDIAAACGQLTAGRAQALQRRFISSGASHRPDPEP